MKELSILQQREKLARAAMQLALEDQQAEDSVDLYIYNIIWKKLNLNIGLNILGHPHRHPYRF